MARRLSLSTLRDALRRAGDGLLDSTYTIGRALHAAGYSWQKRAELVRDRCGRA